MVRSASMAVVAFNLVNFVTAVPFADRQASDGQSLQARAPPPRPAGVPNLPGYTYQGCWSDDPAHRVLQAVFRDDVMTVGKCAEYCPSSKYIGLQWGSECWCGPTLDAASVLVADQSECNKPCAGDASTICGAGVRLTLYEKNVGTPQDPEHPAIDGYKPVSCYTDKVTDRTLPFVSSHRDMTLELCAHTAKTGGYKYFGVEFGTECWLGNELNPIAAAAADPMTCNKPCAGNPAQTCGGPDRLNLYVSDPTSTPDPDPVDPDAPFEYAPTDCRRVNDYNYNYRSCLVRGFPVPTNDITRIMYPTMEQCAFFCYDFRSICSSFSWNMATKECTLYRETTWEVIGDLVGSAAHKDIYISDRQCWACQPR